MSIAAYCLGTLLGIVAYRFVTLLAEEIAHVADYAIGLIAAAFSLQPCGYFPKVNFYTERALEK